eukprot:3262058-Prymnesium_polylepis.2
MDSKRRIHSIYCANPISVNIGTLRTGGRDGVQCDGAQNYKCAQGREPPATQHAARGPTHQAKKPLCATGRGVMLRWLGSTRVRGFACWRSLTSRGRSAWRAS